MWKSEVWHRARAWIARHAAPRQRGTDLVEYAMLIALIAVVVVGVVALLGTNFSLLLGEIANEVGP